MAWPCPRFANRPTRSWPRGAIDYHRVIFFFLGKTGLVIFIVKAPGALRRRASYSQISDFNHRNSMAPYKLSDVSQEWQLRVWYHLSCITFGSSVEF